MRASLWSNETALLQVVNALSCSFTWFRIDYDEADMMGRKTAIVSMLNLDTLYWDSWDGNISRVAPAMGLLEGKLVTVLTDATPGTKPLYRATRDQA